MNQGHPSVPQQPDNDWHTAYAALVLETFEVDEAILLLKLLEHPDSLREALQHFADFDDDEPKVDAAED